MKKAKKMLAKAIEAEINEPVFDIEYELSKSSKLMLVWKDQWYLSGKAYTSRGTPIYFFSSLGVRQILKGCVARWSERDMAIQITS